jgi:hypothetical protein
MTTHGIASGATKRAALLALATTAALFVAPARAADADEAELLKSFDKVDVWHFPVDYAVRYNDRDVVVTRELVAQPAPAGELCYVRFDLIESAGEYSYGFKPESLGGERSNSRWGVYVRKIGGVLDQMKSSLKMNVIYFYVDGKKKDAPADLCAVKQAAPTAQAGNAYKGEWSDLVVRARLIHGWPAAAAR